MICPTAQQKCLRQINATGKSVAMENSCQVRSNRYVLVIPGRAGANPESIAPHECWAEWIPGSALRLPRNDNGYSGIHATRYSSGSTFTIEAPWLLPTQKLTGVVELSTKTRRMLVLRGKR